MTDATDANGIVGRLQMHPNGFGFVHVEGDAENIFIPPRRAGGALDADLVEVVARPSEKGLEGKVIRVVERRRTRIVAVLRRAGKKRWWLELEDRRIVHEVVMEGTPSGAVVGDVVVARITQFPERERDPVVVEVERSIGAPGLLQTEVAKILVEHNVDESFPPDVEAAAEKVPTEVGRKDLANRDDLRDLPFMTIDPDDARDFDDAVCVELLGEDPRAGDMRLHVAVADVSHYVREGTEVDREAAWRCFSVYLPDRAIPMLPEALSTHMCSLVPHEDRLARVVSMTIKPSGEVVDVEPRAAIIHSQQRLTYGQVARELTEDGRGSLPAEIGDRVRTLREASDRLRRHRMTRGAIELNLPESRVVLDEDDPERIRDVVRSRSSKEMARAYNLIEEMMVAANEAVGGLAMKAKLPLPYRVHDRPDEEKLGLLTSAAASLGISINADRLRTPRGVQKFLSQTNGRDRGEALHNMMLRAMAQADYRTENVGHFALSATAYVHFTSPIRRYPDLIAHRVIKAYLAKRKGPSGPRPVPKMPQEESTRGQCIRSSERERAAAQAERDTQKLFAAAHMRDRIGDRFEGTVSGFSGQGMFVTLDSPFVDGMVRLQQMERELGNAFEADGTGVRLVGSGGKLITIGDRVVVEVEEASLVRRQVDLVLVSVLSGPRLTKTEEAIAKRAVEAASAGGTARGAGRRSEPRHGRGRRGGRTVTGGAGRREQDPSRDGEEEMSVLEAARAGKLPRPSTETGEASPWSRRFNMGGKERTGGRDEDRDDGRGSRRGGKGGRGGYGAGKGRGRGKKGPGGAGGGSRGRPPDVRPAPG